MHSVVQAYSNSGTNNSNYIDGMRRDIIIIILITVYILIISNLCLYLKYPTIFNLSIIWSVNVYTAIKLLANSNNVL